jgi:hypothetical protein
MYYEVNTAYNKYAPRLHFQGHNNSHSQPLHTNKKLSTCVS